MVEHHVDIVGVVGSIPTVPTINFNYMLFFLLNYIKDRSIMKKPNKIREARLNKMRSRKNNIRKEKVRLKKIEEANAPQPEPQQ